MLSLMLAGWSVLVLADRLSLGQEGYVNREQEIQAAYLYNFGKYVSWPNGDSAQQFVIGFIGESAIHEPLVKVARSKALNDKPIVVKQFRAASEYQSCQILYVPEGLDRELVARILERAQKEPTLIVGERRTSAADRTMIRFFPEGNTLRFEIDPRRAEQAGLKISSKLLTLGKIVGD